MISFLTLASHYMGMINVKSKLKNQVYTVMAFVGNWYLLYIGIRFLQNGRYLRGLLLLAIFLVFLYFSIMNIYYFFTTKKAPFDISPILEKYVGGAPEEIREKEEFRRRLAQVERQSRQASGSPAGMFDQRMLLPAQVESTGEQKRNIEQIAMLMKNAGILFEDYGGQSDEQIKEQLQPGQTEAYAIGDEGIQFPFADIKIINGQPTIYAGLNQMEELPVGVITKVGAASFEAAKQENHLYLADVLLSGGEKKMIGRSGIITENENFFIKVNIAYKRRNTSLHEV
ncbi:DUF6681 family protein [Pediococcus pentosaceus]|uniref:Uncharacterized protein n=1 Tax=Pediococcus pentosaceus TaxID=1255 RepID=A0AB73HFK9_PEDPE|nr:DUF6681 family protein [Pediococcus pentosaceus]MBF7115029.1 hypothetical protein [Pediococcus pentosaceus]MCM6812464.1 hypothetical protein [Pediococcus pentosaceus]MCM6819079.1 hypothetical protein [Pediococcus pentosaceus]MDN3207083.1 hypothetical protein [Pediococcus pentosaceus]